MTRSLNLTRLWHKAHSHLQPFTEHLALTDQHRFVCPICTQQNAFKLTIQVRYGEHDWESAEPIYCPDCYEYSLLDVPINKAPLTAVDARLWSAEPTFLNIEPTTRCNFNCWYCVGRHMQQEDITVENFVQVLDNCPSVKTIALVGEGEPLMHKGFFTMAKMAKERNVRVMIISNGSTLSQSIVKQLCEAEVAYIGISIDSIDPDVFASSRIDGKLEKIWQGIQRLRAYRDANDFQYPKIGLKGTLFSYNKTELPDIVAMAKSYGVEIFESFQALNPMRTYIPIYPKQSPSEVAHIDEVADMINQDSVQATQQLRPFAEFCATEGIEIDKNGTANNVRNNCDEQWIYALLSGDITPCCQIKTPISPTWNLFKHTLTDILSDHQYENTRFNLWNGIFPSYCEGCWKIR